MSNEIFVFGSNLAGRHGKGAAAYALKHKGAVYGQGTGLQGMSYAIPTKDENLRTLSLLEIKFHVEVFKRFARSAQEDDWNVLFNITRVGCGLAGYDDEAIAPMFSGVPENCILPEGWGEIIERANNDKS